MTAAPTTPASPSECRVSVEVHESANPPHTTFVLHLPGSSDAVEIGMPRLFTAEEKGEVLGMAVETFLETHIVPNARVADVRAAA